MSEVKLIKLVTGEELLASVTDYVETMILENPYVMVMGPEGAGIMPWMPYAETDNVEIDKNKVIAVLELKESVKQSYSKMVGKIILSENRVIM